MLNFKHMRQATGKADKKIVNQLLAGKVGQRYQGKQVIVCEGEIHVVPNSSQRVDQLLIQLTKKYPGSTPTVTFVPKPSTYILVVCP